MEQFMSEVTKARRAEKSRKLCCQAEEPTVMNKLMFFSDKKLHP
jgi:hypothetical protein